MINSHDLLPIDYKEISIEHQKLVLDRIKKSNANSSRLLKWDEASKLLNTNKK